MMTQLERRGDVSGSRADPGSTLAMESRQQGAVETTVTEVLRPSRPSLETHPY